MGNHRVGAGLQFATVPASSGHRSRHGREIGPRCRRSEIARQCVAAVGQERSSGKPGGLFLWLLSSSAKAKAKADDPVLIGFAIPTDVRVYWMPAFAGMTAEEGHSSRAAARSIISPRRICAGAILSFMKASTSGGAVSG